MARDGTGGRPGPPFFRLVFSFLVLFGFVFSTAPMAHRTSADGSVSAAVLASSLAVKFWARID